MQNETYSLNILKVNIFSHSSLNLIINGEEVSIALSLNDGVWHHVVLTWSSLRGDWKIYVDGVLKDQGYNLSTAKPIPGLYMMFCSLVS